jgi:hypothetical protein
MSASAGILFCVPGRESDADTPLPKWAKGAEIRDLPRVSDTFEAVEPTKRNGLRGLNRSI